MAPDQPTSVPAGWYPDPRGVAELRWWDGRDWTGSVHPPLAPPTAPAPVAPPTVEPVAEPIAEPAAEPVAEPAATPDSGLNFPPPPMKPPGDEAQGFGSRVYDLDYVPQEPTQSAPVAAQPVAAQPVAEEPSIAAPEPVTIAEPTPATPPAEPIPAAALVEPTPVAPLVEPTAEAPVATPEPAAPPIDSLPSRRELRERGGTLPVSPPVTPTPVPDSSTPTSFDWISAASVAAETATPPERPPADSAWNEESTAQQQDPEELYHNAPTRTSTTSGWFIALMPLFAGILSVGAVKGAENYPRYVPEGTAWWMLVAGVLVLLYLVTLLLAAADRRKLDGAAHSYPAHWAWALLTAPVYLGVRTFAVKRETGRMSALLWVWIALAALLVGGYLLADYLAPQLLAPYTLPFL